MHIAWSLSVLALTLFRIASAADFWTEFKSVSSGNLTVIRERYEKCLAEETATDPDAYTTNASKYGQVDWAFVTNSLLKVC